MKVCERCGDEAGQFGHRGCQRELEATVSEKAGKIKRAIEEHLADGGLVTDPDWLVARIEAALKPTGLSFPCEYRGWRVEIKMGHEFKGTRGSTRRSRGYMATNLQSGQIQEFPPSAGSSAGFVTVKKWIDVMVASEQDYRT